MDWSVTFTKLDVKRSKLYIQVNVNNNGFRLFLTDKLNLFPMYLSWKTKRKWLKTYYEPNVTIFNEVSSHALLLKLNKTMVLDLPIEINDNTKERDYFYNALRSSLYEWLNEEYSIYSNRSLLNMI